MSAVLSPPGEHDTSRRDPAVLRLRARQACIAAAVAGAPVRLLEHMVTASVDEPPLPAWGVGEYYLDNWPAAARALGHTVPASPGRHAFVLLDEREAIARRRRNARQVVDRHTTALVDAGLLEVMARRRNPMPGVWRLLIPRLDH